MRDVYYKVEKIGDLDIAIANIVPISYAPLDLSRHNVYDWRHFLKAHNLEQSMSRRGNCHDNAVAENFFQLLKRERVRRRIYATRDEARQDILDYIEMFHNSMRQHSFSNDMSPVEYEKQYFQRL